VAITTDNGSEFARWRQIEAALKHAQEALNHRPRARLNGNTPFQAFYDATSVAIQS
jgi:IS30 family transposase